MWLSYLNASYIPVPLEDTDKVLDITKHLAEKLYQEITAPIEYEGGVVDVGVSVGVCLFPNDFDDLEIAVKLADKAMYFAKQHNQSIIYVADLPEISAE